MADAERMQLVDLIAAYVEGWGSPAQFQQLEQLLENSAESRRYYIDHLDMHARLTWERGRAAPLVLSLPRRFNRTSWIALAASLLLVGYFAAIVGLLAWDRLHRADDHERIAAAHSSQPSARLTHADDAYWETSSTVNTNDESASRTLQVRSGVAEVKFAQGATVVVEGPAEFEVRSTNGGFLQRGKLVARVPKESVGFTVQTATATVVDLGTEFVIKANELGTTEVQVIEGRVELRPKLKRDGLSSVSPFITLAAGEARRVERSGQEGDVVVRKISATSGSLARELNAQQLQRIAVEGATASSTWGVPDFDVDHLIRGHGLKGDAHSASSPGNMWHSAAGRVRNEFVLFDLLRPHRLDSMKVWNFNGADGDLYAWAGLKQADIYVSASGKGDPLSQPAEWNLVVADQQFAPGTGKDDYATPTVVQLGNAEGRFVAIVVDEALRNNPRAAKGEPDVVGFSEVQFFGSRVKAPNPQTKPQEK